MIPPQGPGAPFQLLFSDVAESEPSLPVPFRRLYPGDWHLPIPTDRPYIYSNFALSRDGRITYKIPGLTGGADVTNFDKHDAWLMGLLRARADAVLNGDVTVDLEPDSLWTAADVYPDDAPAFADLRQAEGRHPLPIQVILSFEAKLNYEAACFQQADLHIVLATTARGAANAKGVQTAATLDVLNLGEDQADLSTLVRILHHDYGVKSLLCEGGAHVFANMLADRLIDEEFIALSPHFVGRDATHFRPSYTEGVAWQPGDAPYSKPLSLHRAGDFLYLRTRCLHHNR